MLNHLMTNNLIAKEQHGFVKFESCVTNLLETVDQITNSLNSGHPSIVIFLDFAKAFDKQLTVSMTKS